MWFWIILFGLFVLITLIMPWFQRASINQLEGDIEKLKRRVHDLEKGVTHTAQSAYTSTQTKPEIQAQEELLSPWIAAKMASPLQKTAVFEENAVDSFFVVSWLRENWLLAIGSMFMIFAAGWLVRYSILHELIGPVGRVIGGMTLGLGIIGVAQYRIRTHISQGSIFAALGSAIVLLTIFGAQKYYNMFTPASSMAFMLMTVVLTSFISVRYQAERLSHAGILLAGIIPLLVSTGNKDFIALFSYLAVVTAGTLWVVVLTGWRKNILLALLLVFFYSFPALDNHSGWFQEPWIGLAFAFGFGLTFFAVSLITSLNEVDGEKTSDVATAGILGIFIISWIVRVAPHEWQSLLLAGWMLLFSGASYRLFVRTADSQFFYVYSGVSSLLLVAATAVQFSGPALTLAFIAEAGLLPLLTWRALGDARKTAATTLFAILPLFLSLDSLDRSNWPDGIIFHSHFFVMLMMTVVLAGLTYFLSQIKKMSSEPVEGINVIMAVGSGITVYYAGNLAWRTLHAMMFNDDLATTVSLCLFMLTGIASYFMGHRREMKLLRIYGGLIIGWVSLRLLFIDMPNMDVGGKVVTFFILGALLLGTAFLERQKKAGIK
jgi:hypothetical protein